MSLPTAVTIGAMVARRAALIGLTDSERTMSIVVVMRDWARRSGRLLDRRQPSLPCVLVPAPCVRVDVLEAGAGWRYDLRRVPRRA